MSRSRKAGHVKAESNAAVKAALRRAYHVQWDKVRRPAKQATAWQPKKAVALIPVAYIRLGRAGTIKHGSWKVRMVAT